MRPQFDFTVMILSGARKEILEWPESVRKNLGSVLTRLQRNLPVGFPDIRPMPLVTQGCFEIRLKDVSGSFRAFYIIKTDLEILVFHAFQKKTQKTPKREIETAIRRLRIFQKEFADEKE